MVTQSQQNLLPATGESIEIISDGLSSDLLLPCFFDRMAIFFFNCYCFQGQQSCPSLLIRVTCLRCCLCFCAAEDSLLYSVTVCHTDFLCCRFNDRTTKLALGHSHTFERSKRSIRWPSDGKVADIFTVQCYKLTHGSEGMRHCKPRITSNLSSRSSTMKQSLCSLPLNM